MDQQSVVMTQRDEVSVAAEPSSLESFRSQLLHLSSSAVHMEKKSDSKIIARMNAIREEVSKRICFFIETLD